MSSVSWDYQTRGGGGGILAAYEGAWTNSKLESSGYEDTIFLKRMSALWILASN